MHWKQAKLQMEKHANSLKTQPKLSKLILILTREVHKSKISKYPKQTCLLKKVTTLKTLVLASGLLKVLNAILKNSIGSKTFKK